MIWSFNQIGDEGGRALAEALKTNKILSLSVLICYHPDTLERSVRSENKILPKYFRKLQENYAVDDLDL